jgi:hypothetical protein
VIFGICIQVAQAAQISLQCEDSYVNPLFGVERSSVPIVIDTVARRVLAWGAVTDLETTHFNEAFVRAYIGDKNSSRYTTFSINRITGEFEETIIDRPHPELTSKGFCKILKPLF